MKVLYAFQGTGNGHIARAQEIIPILKKYAQVDTLMSGHQTQLHADFELNYQYKGVSLLYNKSGGLSYSKTFRENNFIQTIRDIRSVHLKKYDLIINDFEPITTWACKGTGLPMIEVSHQAAMKFKETPKPEQTDWLGSLVLQYYAPSKEKIGFHFEAYHPKIKTPIIRTKIRTLDAYHGAHYLVYLPSYADHILLNILQAIAVPWKVFSKYAKSYTKIGNVEIYPIDENHFLQAFASCIGVLCNAGFEMPSEALFLGKKLFVIPIQKQYEQACNACALHQLGVHNANVLSVAAIAAWVNSAHCISIVYPDETEKVLVEDVLKFA